MEKEGGGEYVEHMKRAKKSLFSAYFILFLDNFGYAVTFPLFPLLLLTTSFDFLPEATLTSTRNILLGILLAAFPLAKFFGAPFFGDTADRFGRKKTLIWTLAGTVLGYALSALAIYLKSYSFLLFSRLLSGFFSGNLVISLAIISDLNPSREKRAKGMSVAASCLGLGITAAIVAGGVLTAPEILSALSPAFAFWALAVVSLLNLVVLFLFYQETATQISPDAKISFTKPFRNILSVIGQKTLHPIYLFLFFWFFGFFLSIQWVVPLSVEKFQASRDEITWLLVIFGLCWALSGVFLNRRLLSKFSIWPLTLWSLFLVSFLYFICAIDNFFLYFTLAYILSGIFIAFCLGNTMTLISLAISAEGQGKALGVGQSVTSLAQFLSPFLGGFLAGFSIELIFYACALFVLVSFLSLLTYVLRRKQKT
ncbi:MAG: Tetracycline resistance protein, class B [Chlamydiae bacterium]|nr:Tetracycline resistance protein, class B [Chlamydiota bacterium]